MKDSLPGAETIFNHQVTRNEDFARDVLSWVSIPFAIGILNS